MLDCFCTIRMYRLARLFACCNGNALIKELEPALDFCVAIWNIFLALGSWFWGIKADALTVELLVFTWHFAMIDKPLSKLTAKIVCIIFAISDGRIVFRLFRFSLKEFVLSPARVLPLSLVLSQTLQGAITPREAPARMVASNWPMRLASPSRNAETRRLFHAAHCYWPSPVAASTIGQAL